MHFFDKLLSTPAENLALEEAWLDMAEEGLWSGEILRLWQADQPFIVIGRGSRIADEVNVDEANRAGVPILRRMSGGAAIVAAPGCAMYAVLLSYEKRPHLRMLDQAHRLVMQTMLAGLCSLSPSLTWDGTCDLVLNARKVSGNSLRCRRHWMLYHGTLLLAMNLELADRFLLHPPREPEYRQKRQHGQFIANLDIDYSAMAKNLMAAWQAHQANDESQRPPIPDQAHPETGRYSLRKPSMEFRTIKLEGANNLASDSRLSIPRLKPSMLLAVSKSRSPKPIITSSTSSSGCVAKARALWKWSFRFGRLAATWCANMLETSRR